MEHSNGASADAPVTLPATLEEARIPGLPSSFYYIPNFITADEEAALLSKINAQPPHKWTQLTHRRLQVHPAPLTPSNVLLLPPSSSPLPPWLSDPLLPRFAALGVFAGTPHAAPNHVLVNEYGPGQGILAHEDGAAYAAVTATVSLGSHCVLDISSKNGKEGWSLLCEARSLLVTRGEEAYAGCLHGIEEVGVDEELGVERVANWEMLGERGRFESGRAERGTRVSLTCRDVVKVSRVGEKLLRGGRR